MNIQKLSVEDKKVYDITAQATCNGKSQPDSCTGCCDTVWSSNSSAKPSGCTAKLKWNGWAFGTAW